MNKESSCSCCSYTNKLTFLPRQNGGNKTAISSQRTNVNKNGLVLSFLCPLRLPFSFLVHMWEWVSVVLVSSSREREKTKLSFREGKSRSFFRSIWSTYSKSTSYILISVALIATNHGSAVKEAAAPIPTYAHICQKPAIRMKLSETAFFVLA